MFEKLKKWFGKPQAPPTRLQELIGDGAMVVDVRTRYEFKQGHLHGSINIPLNELPAQIDNLRKQHKTIITVCRSGARSATAKDMLTAAGVDSYNGGSWFNLVV